MATWWELTIPVGGTLIGAFVGAWTQARSNLRTIKIQNMEAAQVRRESREHELAMKLLDDKRDAYIDFVIHTDRCTDYANPKPNSEEWDNYKKEVDKFIKVYERLQFLAPANIFEVADQIYLLIAGNDEEPIGPLVNQFVKMAREDLGVGGSLPSGWVDMHLEHWLAVMERKNPTIGSWTGPDLRGGAA